MTKDEIRQVLEIVQANFGCALENQRDESEGTPAEYLFPGRSLSDPATLNDVLRAVEYVFEQLVHWGDPDESLYDDDDSGDQARGRRG